MSSLLSGIRSLSPQSPIDTLRPTLNDVRLFVPTPLTDALDDLVHAHTPSDRPTPRRDAPTPDTFAGHTHSYDILNQYIVGSQWRALALASEASILETPATEERTLLKLWTYRVLALCSLGHYANAAREIRRLEVATTSAQVYKNGRSPTIVWPFELRVLRAQVAGLAIDDWPLCADRLSSLLRACRRQLACQTDVELNQQRTVRLLFMLASCAVRMRDAQLAIRVMDHLVTESPNDPRLLSAVARLHLQLGSIRQAELQFMRIEQLVPSDDKLARMNRALYAVASGKYEAARELFNSVAGDAIEDRVCAANNACVCDVYLGHPQRMLDALQKLMVAAPRAAGASEELVFNYCTGLDLQYDGQKLREEKARKMVDVAMWAGDGFNTASFKLQ